MLGLKLATDPRWVNIAEKSIEEVLVDHAYCEQKAATNCISIIINFPDKKDVVDALSPIVTEEWGHFRMVIRELDKRGLPFGQKRKDDYVKQLSKLIISGGDRENQLVERLLLAALIEARSCERFKILSENLEDEDLKKFYRELMISEASHYRLFIDLAKNYWSEEKVKTKFEYYLKEEAKILAVMDVRGDRVH